MSESEPSHYEILGLPPRATLDQIERAFRFFESMYDDGALATYSLLADAEARSALGRLREAYAVLKDPVRRHEYDVAHGFAPSDEPLLPLGADEGAPQPRVAHAVPTVLGEPVDGPSLKRVREERGISLQTIARESKIGVRLLEYIEADRHELLPAPVYVRGFVREYARIVGLDPAQTAESYLKPR